MLCSGAVLSSPAISIRYTIPDAIFLHYKAEIDQESEITARKLETLTLKSIVDTS